MDQLITYLLSLHHIHFDNEELTFQIQSHPSYPSLHSITGVLDHFNIDNVALDVPIDKDTLSQLPDSFLAQINIENEKEFVVVKKDNNNSYKLFYSNQKKETISIYKFLEKFTGIIVAIEKPETVEYKKSNESKINTILSIVSLLLLAGLFIKMSSNLSIALYFLLSVVGVYVSISIIKQELGEKTILGDAFCSQTSSTNNSNNCNAVLSSKGAQFGTYKLSDFSIIYFVGLLCSTLLLTLVGSNLSSLFILSLITIPVTIYSIYYQYAVVKQWCFLCLSITAILWIQATLILYANYNTLLLSNISLDTVLIISFSFLSVSTTWNLFSPNIKLIKDLKASKVKYFKFKRDYNLFEALLNKSTVVDTFIPNTSELIFGNKNAPLNITVVTSPFCGHCKAVHDLIEKILKKHPENIQICIRFSVNEANIPLSNITSRLLELYDTEGEIKCLEAMHDIYNDMNDNSWGNKWGETNNRTPYLNTLKSASEWCKANSINFTPEILISGRSFPKAYERSELLYFIEDLYENSNVENIPVLEIIS